ncbi:Alpha beta-hydrolase [Mycena kentingensis (nom. inval.)]|nr:Alpha beta-hydrolase [Mycena kentingensis (nom. inval.)]
MLDLDDAAPSIAKNATYTFEISCNRLQVSHCATCLGILCRDVDLRRRCDVDEPRSRPHFKASRTSNRRQTLKTMVAFSSQVVLFYLSAAAAGAMDDTNPGTFNLQPFKVDLSARFARLRRVVANTRLPDVELYPGNGQDKGVPLASLREWKDEWVGRYDWDEEQGKLNALDHFTATIEDLKIHFIHQKAKAKNAVPIILLHGWPGSFHEFLPVIEPLTKPASVAVAFDVVIPSLPGFVFSAAPKTQNWTVVDTARVFHTLMTEVLGYDKYTLHGTDWGSTIGYTMYTTYGTSILGANFPFLPFFPPSRAELAANSITLLPAQETALQRSEDWGASGMDYLNMLTHKPNDLGYALYDNPLGQLALIGGKLLLWSQPPPSPFLPAGKSSNTSLLTAISLYALTDSVISAGWIYAANPTSLRSVYAYEGLGSVEDAPPMVFSHFQFNLAVWPEEYVSKVGRLVAYRVHETGGHFPGLDNPTGVVEDIRELATFFYSNPTSLA